MSKLETTILSRAKFLLRNIKDVSPMVYVAGSCLNKQNTPFNPGLRPNDVDLFPKPGVEIEDIVHTMVDCGCELVFESKNAKTWKLNGTLFQVCDYRHDFLTELVRSFDFSHVQIGANIKGEGVYVTDAWKNSMMGCGVTFTGSEYPLSSLIRLNKYVQRGAIDKKTSKLLTLKILGAVLERGFRDYDDLKDQLDAIDLLLKDDDENYIKSLAMPIFECLRKDSDD